MPFDSEKRTFMRAHTPLKVYLLVSFSLSLCRYFKPQSFSPVSSQYSATARFIIIDTFNARALTKLMHKRLN